MMLVVSAEIALWAGDLDRLHAMLSGRFRRAEPRRRVRSYIAGLVAGLDRKNGYHGSRICSTRSTNTPIRHVCEIQSGMDSTAGRRSN